MVYKRMTDLELSGKRVLIRQDLNVPVRDGLITSSARLDAALPTIKLARDAGARVLLMSHLGRPREGHPEAGFSLAPVADYLGEKLGSLVALHEQYLEKAIDVAPGEVGLLENVRFNVGEKANCEKLARQYAGLCDIFVMDAFGTAHRAQASTHGIARYARVACAGPLLAGELDALTKALHNPDRPLVAIVGGAKVSTKLTLLESLSGVVDQLIPGGGIANTFIAAAGFPVGKSLYEPDLVDQAKSLIQAARNRGSEIPIPVDVVVGEAFSETAKPTIKPVSEIVDDELILDIGPQTIENYTSMLKGAGTIVWNGPVGVFEFAAFAEGTRALGQAIADSSAFSIAGGGDTLAAIDQFDLTSRMSYISTGGGAFLEFLEGRVLPAVEMLESRA